MTYENWVLHKTGGVSNNTMKEEDSLTIDDTIW
jgi:hypothetical protein